MLQMFIQTYLSTKYARLNILYGDFPYLACWALNYPPPLYFFSKIWERVFVSYF